MYIRYMKDSALYFFTLLIKVFEMTHGRPNDVQRMKTDKVFVAVVVLI